MSTNKFIGWAIISSVGLFFAWVFVMVPNSRLGLGAVGIGILLAYAHKLIDEDK